MKLFVKLIDGLFVLYEADPGVTTLEERAHSQVPIRIACKAQAAQGIQDYCNAIYPAGTGIHWMIVPRPWAGSRPRIPIERVA